MKQNDRVCTFIGAGAGYLELARLVWWYQEEWGRMLSKLGLYAILIIAGVLNLLVWGGYMLEK